MKMAHPGGRGARRGATVSVAVLLSVTMSGTAVYALTLGYAAVALSAIGVVGLTFGYLAGRQFRLRLEQVDSDSLSAANQDPGPSDSQSLTP